jgi:hypothetical protein
MEDIHGTRNKAIGQLRSAVVPYSISVLYAMFGGTEKREPKFDLESLWKRQEINDNLKTFLKVLMVEMYLLIKKYKLSDDISENTKKRELWELIKKSKELKEFTSSTNAITILESYTSITRKTKKNKEVDFGLLNETIDLHSKTKLYFSKLEHLLIEHNVNSENPIQYSPERFMFYMNELFASNTISERGVKFFNDLFPSIRKEAPSIFDEIDVDPDLSLITTLDKIMTIYGNALNDGRDLEFEFQGYEKLAIKKNIKYAGVLNKIGKSLKIGQTPTFKEVELASNYFKN